MKVLKFVVIIFAAVLLFGCATGSNTNPNLNILIETSSQGISIGTKDRSVKIFVPTRTFRIVNERMGGGQNNPNYFYFTDTKVDGTDVGLHFSGWLFPIERYTFNEVGELWAISTDWENNFNHDFRKTGNWDVYMFDVPVPETFKDVFSSHMRANLLYEDTWIDLHLSITDRKPSEQLHDILFEYLKTVQVRK